MSLEVWGKQLRTTVGGRIEHLKGGNLQDSINYLFPRKVYRDKFSVSYCCLGNNKIIIIDVDELVLNCGAMSLLKSFWTSLSLLVAVQLLNKWMLTSCKNMLFYYHFPSQTWAISSAHRISWTFKAEIHDDLNFPKSNTEQQKIFFSPLDS